MAERKDQLRGAALDYLLKHGVANASLRPMAAALGTSARILMFHFKSKEGLLREVLEELQRRLQASFASMADSGPRRVAPLKRFWLWATRAENYPYLRLLYEAQIIAVQNPAEYGRYLKEASTDWQAISVRALSESIRSGPMATLCIAVFDGLMLEFMSTGNLRETTRALDHFIAIASPPEQVPKKRTAAVRKTTSSRTGALRSEQSDLSQRATSR
jgi:AcrR family transcriptional regulator